MNFFKELGSNSINFDNLAIPILEKEQTIKVFSVDRILKDYPEYNSLDDIPIEKLSKITKKYEEIYEKNNK